MKKTISDADIIKTIIANTADDGQGPSIRLIARQLERTPSGIHRRLADLVRADAVEYRDGGLHLTPGVVDLLTGPQSGTATISWTLAPGGLRLAADAQESEPF